RWRVKVPRRTSVSKRPDVHGASEPAEQWRLPQAEHDAATMSRESSLSPEGTRHRWARGNNPRPPFSESRSVPGQPSLYADRCRTRSSRHADPRDVAIGTVASRQDATAHGRYADYAPGRRSLRRAS